jgi:hypothetical protein
MLESFPYSIIPGGSQRGWPQKTLYFQIFVEIPRRCDLAFSQFHGYDNAKFPMMKRKPDL